MSSVINAISNFFEYIRTFVGTFWSLLKKMFSLFGIAVQYINLVLHALPVWLWIILTILLSVCILYKVLNRET